MERRIEDFTVAISKTMGCPRHLAKNIQVKGTINAFRTFAKHAFEMQKVEDHGDFIILKEAVGVCTLINP